MITIIYKLLPLPAKERSFRLSCFIEKQNYKINSTHQFMRSQLLGRVCFRKFPNTLDAVVRNTEVVVLSKDLVSILILTPDDVKLDTGIH